MVLSEEEKTALIELDIFRAYQAGTILLKAGQISSDGYFVLKGYLRSYYIVDGEEKTTRFHAECESLSPATSIHGKPSDYYVSCEEDCILTVGNPEMEKRIFERFPRFESLCRILSEELLTQNQAEFDHFKTSSPEQRYLELIIAKPSLVQRVPQYHLASYLGITPQSLSRIRRRIARKKT